MQSCNFYAIKKGTSAAQTYNGCRVVTQYVKTLNLSTYYLELRTKYNQRIENTCTLSKLHVKKQFDEKSYAPGYKLCSLTRTPTHFVQRNSAMYKHM